MKPAAGSAPSGIQTEPLENRLFFFSALLRLIPKVSRLPARNAAHGVPAVTKANISKFYGRRCRDTSYSAAPNSL